MNKAKLYKLTNTIISIVIGGIALYYLISLLKEKADGIGTPELVGYVSFQSLLFTLFLMPANWLIETYKWMQVTQRMQKINPKKALESILIGILSSIISPNRIGELGGRLLHIKKENLLAVFYSNILCSISQLLITIVVGLFAIIMNVDLIADQIDVSATFLLIVSIISIIVTFSFYFSSNLTYRLIRVVSAKFKAKEHFVGSRINKIVRMKLILMSGLRYLVFSIQFMLLLDFFGSEFLLFESFSAIALVFFITTAIPTAWISDLPVRSSVAYFIFELFLHSGMHALYSSIALWMINLLLPALIGIAFLPKVNWKAIKKIPI